MISNRKGNSSDISKKHHHILKYYADFVEKGKHYSIICLIFICACLSKEPPDATEETSSNGSSAKVIVDKLRLRDQPNLSSSTLALLPINSELNLTGEKTDTTEIININGQQKEDYWFRAQYQSFEGWVYGGGIEQIVDISNPYLIIPGKAVGLITANDSESSLIAKLGADQVIRSTFLIGDSVETEGNIIFPNSEKEMKIIWHENDFQTLFCIEIDKPNSPYYTGNGLGINTELSEVQRINKKAFTLFGFDWSYSGKVDSWEGGVIEEPLKLYFEPQNQDVHESLQGDVLLLSDNYRLEVAQPIVYKIRVYFDA